MTWFFGQLWFLILIGFLVGSLIAWAIAKAALPHVDELESLAREAAAQEGAE